MIVTVLRSPTPCAASITCSHCGGLDLVGADHRANLVVEDFGGGAGQRTEPRLVQLGEEIGEVRPSVLAPCQISSGEKAWMWMPGTASLIARQTPR